MVSKVAKQFNKNKEPEIDPQVANAPKMTKIKSNPPSSDKEIKESDIKELKSYSGIFSQSPTSNG